MRPRSRAAFVLGVCSILASIPSQATAHPSMVTSNAVAGGLFHSFTGLDHALAMIGIGVLSTKLLRSDILRLPLTFLVFLAAGAGLGHFGVEIPYAEIAIALSCLVLGICILSSALQKYRKSMFVLVAGFAMVHGYVHGIELPAGFSAGQFTLGFLLASALMHVTGVFVGEAFKGNEHRWLMHLFGAAMIGFGALFLIRSAPEARGDRGFGVVKRAGLAFEASFHGGCALKRSQGAIALHQFEHAAAIVVIWPVPNRERCSTGT
jgi:urease accessory protein